MLVSHSRAQPSVPKEAAVIPSGLTDIDATLPVCIVMASSECADRSHSRAVVSNEDVTTNLRIDVEHVKVRHQSPRFFRLQWLNLKPQNSKSGVMIVFSCLKITH